MNKLSLELKDVLNDSVKIVNAIRSRPLNSRLFQSLCESINSQHEHLLLHTEVRWLSRERVLSRFLELREETKIFLGEINSPLAAFLLDEMWLCKLAYLGDIFSRRNELNTFLQGLYTKVFILRNKTDASKKKLALWNSLLEKKDTTMFMNLIAYVSSVDINHKDLLNIVSQHLKQLAINFDHHFPADEDPRHGNLLINDPFIQDINSCDLDAHKKESLIKLGCDSTLPSRFKKESLTTF